MPECPNARMPPNAPEGPEWTECLAECQFARELEGLAKAEDVFIAISTSGTSTNIIRAVECAKRMKTTTWCLTGASGGKLCDLAPCVHIPSDNTARIQECHILVGHIICELVEDVLSGGNS